MISYSKAHQLVLETSQDFGIEAIPLENSIGRILAEDIIADRDFPPFDRVTKDGIAISYSTDLLNKEVPIAAIAAAGASQMILGKATHCLEVMTGAILPKNTDTVVMYEDVSISNGIATLNVQPSKGQNIHKQGSDKAKGEILVKAGHQINGQTIGILATVGRSKVLVKKLPKIAIISTGDELVPIDSNPLPHQIRSSNSVTLATLLKNLKIETEVYHLTDNKEKIKLKLEELLEVFDVLLFSGGVSMGKYDFLPEVFEELQVQQIFHKVMQRPGKPFWFGKHLTTYTTIFSFPGNPVSTFVNFHAYFVDWLNACLKIVSDQNTARIDVVLENTSDFTRFVLVRLFFTDAIGMVSPIKANGSGDLVSLVEADGFIIVSPYVHLNKNDLVKMVLF